MSEIDNRIKMELNEAWAMFNKWDESINRSRGIVDSRIAPIIMQDLCKGGKLVVNAIENLLQKVDDLSVAGY